MYTVDIHSSGENVTEALAMLKTAIRMAKREPDHLLCVITGYGSTNKSHKIKTAVLEFLASDTSLGVKGYILGSDLDIFHPNYQKFPLYMNIPKDKMNRKNPGEILVAV